MIENDRLGEVGIVADRAARVAFSFVQAYEYITRLFRLLGPHLRRDFFMATGLHSAHVNIGTNLPRRLPLAGLSRPFHAEAASRLRVCRLVLALSSTWSGSSSSPRSMSGLWRLSASRDDTAPSAHYIKGRPSGRPFRLRRKQGLRRPHIQGASRVKSWRINRETNRPPSQAACVGAVPACGEGHMFDGFLALQKSMRRNARSITISPIRLTGRPCSSCSSSASSWWGSPCGSNSPSCRPIWAASGHVVLI